MLITEMFSDLQSVRIIHFRKEIGRMNRMNRIPKAQNDKGLLRALSCKSCSSCPKHLFWLRFAALGILSLFAANKSKCLSMNHLHATVSFSQSSPVKPSQTQSNHK